MLKLLKIGFGGDLTFNVVFFLASLIIYRGLSSN